MSNYEEENEVCECMKCQLTEEFRVMIKDGVEWEFALRHILNVMASEVNKSDEELADLVDQSFIDGFTEGMATGVEKAQSLMLALVEDTDDRIATIRAEYGLDEDIEDEVDNDGIEDLTDEQFIDIQKIISKGL